MIYGVGKGFFTPFIEKNAQSLQPVPIFDYLLDHPDDEIVQVEMKYNNVLLRSQMGQVFGCGLNSFGELLQPNDHQMKRFPVSIFKKGIKYCALGYKCSIFLDFDGIVTWYYDGRVFKIDGSKLGLEKVVIIGDSPFAIAKYRAFSVKSAGLVDYNQPQGKEEPAFYINRGSMKYKYEKKYGMATFCGSSHFYGCRNQSEHFNSVNSKIIKIEASEDHLVNLHFDKYLTSFGNNQFGKLGIGSSTQYHTLSDEAVGDDNFERLYLDFDENLELDVFVGPLCTVAVTYSNKKIPIDYHAKALLENLVIINEEIEDQPTLQFYFPLIEIISPDLCILLNNEKLMKSLSHEELLLSRELVLFICEVIPYINSGIEPSTVLYYGDFLDNYSYDIKSLTLLLFLLNDIQDCGIVLKEAIFSKLSGLIQVENVMQIIAQASELLSRKVLKNSHNSILMLLVKKCIAFIKSNYSQVSDLHRADEKFVKISTRIEESKQSFESIERTWNEEIFTKVSSLTEAFMLCSKDIHDCTLVIGGTEVQVNRQIVTKSSPVLKVYFEKYSSGSTSYDISEFVKSEESGAESEKIEAIRILLSEVCNCNYSSLKMCSDQTFIYILSISHMFEMKEIMKECCKIMLSERLNLSNQESFISLSPIYDDDTNMRLVLFLLKNLTKVSSQVAKLLPPPYEKKLEEYAHLVNCENGIPAWMSLTLSKEVLTEEEIMSTISFITQYEGPEDYDRSNYYDD